MVDGKLVPGEARKHPSNPGIPWEVRYDNMQPNIYSDGGKYKLWYSSWTTCEASESTAGTRADACSSKGYWPCSGVVGPELGKEGRIPALMYAESEDGITWTKPALGIVTDSRTVANTTDFELNNIVILSNDGSGVLVDEHASNPDERYDKSLDPHGTHNNLAYNPATQRYYGFGRVSNAPFRIESVAVNKTSDFHGEWMPAVKCGLEKDEDLEYQPDALVVLTEPYENTGIYFGFANMLNVTNKPYAGTTDVELAWSTDLLDWKYVAHGTPFIPRGPPGSYDCCEIFGAKQQPVIDGDEMKIWYTGGNGPFMGSRAAGLSLATFQRDWWFGITATKTAEHANRTWVTSIVTKEVVVGPAGQLLISADARQGAVAVGVVGHPGLSTDTCKALRGNLTDAAVSWSSITTLPKMDDAAALYMGGGGPLAALVGKNVTL
eukprot:gene8018-22214_t